MSVVFAGLIVKYSSDVINCIFTMNDAILGGGVYCSGGSPTFTDCQLVLNGADLGGGAYFNASTIDIAGSTFQQNFAVVAQGGAIRAITGTYTITDSTFTQNTAINFGGALDLAENVRSLGRLSVTPPSAERSNGPTHR